MLVSNNASIEKHYLPGLEHQTIAGRRDGLKSFEVWRQTIAPNAATPVHRHDCEEVIMILAGEGVCRLEDRELPFKADETLIIPPNLIHQICNTGSGDMFIIATLAMAPVRVETDRGDILPLPWDSVRE